MKLKSWKRARPPQLEARISIPEVWSDENGIALRGWILTPKGPPDELELTVDGRAIPVIDWHARPDVAAKHPEFQSGERCGFWAYLPRNSARRVQVRARTGAEVVTREIPVRREVDPQTAPAGASKLFERFCAKVNDEQLSVLEIGS